jgi:hypothetical protein
MDLSITLPTHRRAFLCEALAGVDAACSEPMKRVAATNSLLAAQSERGWGLFAKNAAAVGQKMRPELEAVKGLLEMHEGCDAGERPKAADVKALLWSQAFMEQLTEDRALSFERYLSQLVLYHGIAKRVARFPLLWYSTWRSQSSLRIATTAAPVSAADLPKAWRDVDAEIDYLRERERSEAWTGGEKSLLKAAFALVQRIGTSDHYREELQETNRASPILVHDVV